MLRRIIEIDQSRCNGCGLCAKACHEGAIGMVDGKARLLREHFCDGLGDCLPACPVDAIRFVEREAPAYDEAAVHAAKAGRARASANWPVQLRLAPVQAPCFENADLLIAADCAAYVHLRFHAEFMPGRVTLIACPKLDPVRYAEKLTELFSANAIRSILLVRMEVPCCGGLEFAIRAALEQSGCAIPFSTVTHSIQGEILED